MDKSKFIQVGGVTFLVLSIGSQVWKQPGDDDVHIHQETPGGNQPMGRLAFSVGVSGNDVSVPLIGQEIRVNPVHRRDVRHDAGEQPTPFPMRFL